ncbi:MAG: DEAD/DEAH box helicase [Bacteroidota bacterium]
MPTFQELGLRPELMRAIADLGFEQPTPVQEKAIPKLLSSQQDLIAYAQTGTGKTAAFSLPSIHQIDEDSKQIQLLVLNPTRELCLQTSNEIRKFIKYMPKLDIISVYGGDPKYKQAKQLRKGAQIIIGTPGRVHDFIRSKTLKLQNLTTLVLDEADEMLTMGFKDDLDAILEATPSEKQTLLFSATMPKDIRSIVKKYMNQPVEVNAGTENISAENIAHTYSVMKARDKYAALKRFADYHPGIYGIVFCRTRRDTKEIADKLIQDDYSADALHGDLSQSQREHVMKRFRAKQIQLLVATDVAARGLDINNLTHVIHYHLPDQNEAYIHRSGRTGRAGNSGVSIALLNTREKNKVRQLEKMIGKKMVQKSVPSGEEVCEQQLLHFVDRIEDVKIEEVEIAPYLDGINSQLAHLDKEELVKRILSIEFNRFLEYYQDAPDLNYTTKNSKRENGEKRSSRGKMDRYYINIGSRDGLNPGMLIKMLNRKMSGHTFRIGEIEILRNFSFFEIDQGLKEDLLFAFRGAKHKGRELKIELSSEKRKYNAKSNRSENSAFPKKRKRKKKKKKRFFK